MAGQTSVFDNRILYGEFELRIASAYACENMSLQFFSRRLV